MAIKRANVDTKSTVKKSKSDIPTFMIAGTRIDQFNKATKAFKDAKANQDEARDDIMGKIIPIYYGHCESNEHVSSICVSDSTGATVRLTVQDKYSALDASAANVVFESIGYDAGDYALETVSASFDSKVFITNDGQFNEELYREMVEAVARVARKNGVANPLSCSTKVIPRPDFHERRFREFTAAENIMLSEVIKGAVTLTPVVSQA